MQPIRPSIILLAVFVSPMPASIAQDEPVKVEADAILAEQDTPETPETVSVSEVVEDHRIDDRLQEILKSTEWFQSESVEVENGVVFLSGTTNDEKYRKWAGDLAAKTEDVVAVVNRISVTEPPILDLDPAWFAGRDMLRSSIRALPLSVLSIALLAVTWFAGMGVQKLADWTILRRIKTNLLREVGRKAIVIPVFLIGAFLILRVTGLSQLAMTVLGGTGLFGLVIGIAFRDIAENFLSSILLSVQNPFRYGDLIEVDGHLGYVQRVNTRGTLLMTEDGNHVQIPNSTIFKGTIINYTSNPNRRFSFVIGIGYDAPATAAQETALRVLREHPAILDDPEPQVLVGELASSTVNLTVTAWVDAADHSWMKVRSSAMRLTLRAFEDAGFSMPDDQREIVFPAGVPVPMLAEATSRSQSSRPQEESPAEKAASQEDVSNQAEGDFASDAAELQEQAKKSRDPDEAATDLLNDSTNKENPTEKVVQ